VPQFQIDEDVVGLIAKAVQPRPFEGMSTALGRYFRSAAAQSGNSSEGASIDVNKLLAELEALPDAVIERALPNYERKRPRMKSPSPEPAEWAKQIPNLCSAPEFGSWKALCEHFDLDTNGDSARRRLQKWVAAHHPDWPQVPDA
jgi:hypothetical protein